jgi:uncharacterized phiE125 gp8 family phage protein
MSSILAITVAAADRSLLTVEQLRAAVGVQGAGEDSALRDLGARAAATITRACKLKAGGTTPPTLRSESITQAFSLCARADAVVLARKPVSAITSVTENGTTLDEAAYELDAAAGMLYRLCSSKRRPWTYGRWGELKIVVAYTAGWDTVPDDLVRAAQRLVKHFYDTDGQEANLRIDYNEGVNRTEFFAAPGDTLLPGDVDALLGPYKYFSF